MPPRLCVLLLHSTDEPALAVAAIRAAHAAAAAGRPAALFLLAEGARIAARGVLEAMSSGGRPDLVRLVDDFVAHGGAVHASEACLDERQFSPDAIRPGVALEPPDALARLAEAGWVFASF